LISTVDKISSGGQSISIHTLWSQYSSSKFYHEWIND